MHAVNLSAIDLNLLVALGALLEEPNVTRAARKVGLSQPAMSHALGRLRLLLGDPLLVRVGRSMRLTPRAQALSPRVAAVIADLSEVLTPLTDLDPATLRYQFNLFAVDYTLFTIFPALQKLVSRGAPFVDLNVVPTTEVPSAARLRAGEIDIAVGVFPPERQGDIRRVELYEDEFVGLARKGHPKLRGKLDLRTYVSLTHIFISPRGQPGGPVDEELSKKGLTRRVALVVPHFLVVPHLVATSDHIVTMPRRVASAFASYLPVATFDLPIKLAPTRVAMMWHRRLEEDPAQKWLREQIRRIGESRRKE